MPHAECKLCHKYVVVHWRTGICHRCKSNMAKGRVKSKEALPIRKPGPKPGKKYRRHTDEHLGPELVQKEVTRKCLCCEREFKSIANRLCDRCNQNNMDIPDDYAVNYVRQDVW